MAAEVAKKEETPKEGPNERRRSSFFGTLGRGTKKGESAVSDTEGTDNEKKSSKLQGLFRKASQSAKPKSGPATDADAPPVPAKDGAGPATKEDIAEEMPNEDEGVPAAVAGEETKEMTGDVPSNDAAAGAVPKASEVTAPADTISEPSGTASAPAVTASA